jgi:protein CpxP
MKKLMLACCFVIGATAMSFAQGGGGRGMGMKPEERAKQLQTQLKLTDDQTTKVTAIYAVQATKMDSLMKSANPDRAAFRPIMEATTTKVKALLTDEQKAEFDKIQAARMNRGGQGGGGTPPPPPPAPPVK